MEQVFNGRVLPRLGREALHGTLTIDHVVYSPAEKCVVQYGLRHFDRPSSERFAVGTLSAGDELAAVYRSHYGESARAATYLADERCLVEFFPADWQLPSLGMAVDPAGARDQILARPAMPERLPQEREVRDRAFRRDPHRRQWRLRLLRLRL